MGYVENNDITPSPIGIIATAIFGLVGGFGISFGLVRLMLGKDYMTVTIGANRLVTISFAHEQYQELYIQANKVQLPPQQFVASVNRELQRRHRA